jgi:hypothetical protein
VYIIIIVMKKGEVKQKISADYILYLYDKAKKLKSKEKKAALLKQVKILSQHIGEYIVKPLDSE